MACRKRPEPHITVDDPESAQLTTVLELVGTGVELWTD
jgi:hypothetical protein